jgi:hypothetical protein
MTGEEPNLAHEPIVQKTAIQSSGARRIAAAFAIEEPEAASEAEEPSGP